MDSFANQDIQLPVIKLYHSPEDMPVMLCGYQGIGVKGRKLKPCTRQINCDFKPYHCVEHREAVPASGWVFLKRDEAYICHLIRRFAMVAFVLHWLLDFLDIEHTNIGMPLPKRPRNLYQQRVAILEDDHDHANMSTAQLLEACRGELDEMEL